MKLVIYGLAALEIGALLVFLAQFAMDPGAATSAADWQKGLILYLAPIAVIAAATALFHYARAPVLQGVAAFILLVPLLVTLHWAVFGHG